MSNTTSNQDGELRELAIGIAAKYFMATSNDCVSLTADIESLLTHRVQAGIEEFAGKIKANSAHGLAAGGTPYYTISQKALDQLLQERRKS